jgi:predicted nuclease with TOPRIM domain
VVEILMMEKEEFESMLRAHLDPIYKAISKLEEAQERIIIILAEQARQDEAIKHIRSDMERCAVGHNELFSRLRALETSGGDRLWDTVKIFAAAILAGIVGLLVGRGAK